MHHISAVLSALFLLLASITPIQLSGQPHYVRFRDMIQQGTVSSPKLRMPAKPLRVSNRMGNIQLIFDDNVPDSIRTACLAARDAWAAKLPNKYPIFINVRHELMEEDVAMYVGLVYDDELIENVVIPNSLYAQYVGRQDFELWPDAIICFNDEIDWNCSFSDTSSIGYNAYTMMLRGIAISLGFGTTIYQETDEGDDFSFFETYPSVFDKRVYCDDKPLVSVMNNSEGIRDFVTSGDVYVKSDTASYKLYAPPVFEQHRSLKYFDDDATLMAHAIGSGSKALDVDSRTLDVLYSIGWREVTAISSRPIMANDIDESGIASAYTSHSFKIDDPKHATSNHEWAFSIKTLSGDFEEIETGNGTDFDISALNMNEKFHINANGDVEGKIECKYIEDGETVIAEPFFVSFELKPSIFSISEPTLIWDSAYSYHMVFTVNYAGADYVTVTTEEEYGAAVIHTRFDEPFIAHCASSSVNCFYNSWVTVTVKNEYGTASKAFEIEPHYPQ